MAIYRFKVTFEDEEDVYREIDIKSTQTFEDLHNVIQVSINFDNSKGASFYLSDDLWRKGEEFVLNHDKKKDKTLMSKGKLLTYIEDPHQKFIYVFDYDQPWEFYVELIKIPEEDKKINYPKCTKSVGIAPKQYLVIVPPSEEELNDDDEDEGIKKKEKIFTSEETYDKGGDEEEEDVIIDGEEEAPSEDDADVGENENAEEEEV